MSARFICHVIGYQVKFVLKKLGKLVPFWEEPQFASMRKNYSRYFTEFLALTNRYIESGKSKGTSKVFEHLWVLYDFDLDLNERLWQAHIKGALAYAQLIGGPRVALSLPGRTLFFRQQVL